MVHGTRVDGRRRRESILDAALYCFNEHGVHATGIEQIRKRAGASPSSVYHHFDDLDDLSAALLIRTFERVVAHITAAVEHSGNAGDAIRALVRSYVEWVFKHPDETRFMYQATAAELSGSRQQDILEAKTRLYEPLFSYLDQFVAKGELPNRSWSEITSIVLGPSREACRIYLADGAVQKDWMLNDLPEIAWRSLQGL